MPDYQRLLDLDMEIDDLLAERERQADIEQALQLANNSLARGQLIEPSGNNAYEQFNEVLQLDEINQAAFEGLAEIEKRLMADVSSMVSGGDLMGADALLRQVAERYPDSSDVAAVRGQIDEQVRLAREQQQVDDYLAAAQAQVADGRLIGCIPHLEGIDTERPEAVEIELDLRIQL